MASRIYNRTLKCGCMLSSDGGGGLEPCHYGYGCGKEGCNEKHQCDECIKQEKLCVEAWKEWKQTDDSKLFDRECIENNNSDKYLKEILEEDKKVRKLFEDTGGIPDYLGVEVND